ncbi:protein kinase domain-containing protein [Streptomyces zaomyceticus]|uniref:protein kinase domain-containing protein n=1 Tax=Streptomyces zaomyceticus TaxID=68286 RepID=UPI002E2187AC
MASFEDLKPEDPRRVGRYRLVARLGAGGMGRVYLARSPGGRPVAVKVVRPELAEDSDFRRRFAREVTAARRVNGAFTAGVVDADPEGFPAWLATVYVPGVSLGEAITEHGPWPARPVLALGAGLAEALEAIHAVGVVHRDLKPSNILLAADGPRVIDFGISIASGAGALTRTGTTIGTPGFMSPEQLTGRPVGPAGDVFALGAVLAHIGTGTGPFGAGTPDVLHYRAVHEPPDITSLSSELREVVAACLAKDPDRRPSVAQLLDRLASADGAGGGADTATVELLAEPGWMPDRIAQLVQAQTAGDLPDTPSGEPAGPTPPTDTPPAPGPHRTPSRTAEQDHPVTLALRPPEPTGPAPATGPSGVMPPPGDTREPGRGPIARRRTVLGLAGTALTAGAGLTGWKMLTDDTADSGAGPSKSPSESPSPNSTGSSEADGSGSGDSSGSSGDKDAGSGAELAKTTDIPEGGGKVFKSEGVVVTQPEAGTFKAFKAVCTHQGCAVTSIVNGVIICPCHGSTFSITDGRVRSGPATEALPEERISVDGDAITLA